MSRANQRRIDPNIKKQAVRSSLKCMGRMLMLMSIVGVGAGSIVWLNEAWRTTHWEISADESIKAAIEAELAAMPNKDFISMRPDHLRQQWLQNIPDLEAVHITRTLPGSLHIQADARVPTALWQDAQGQLYLFDQLGVAYRALNKGESPDLPLLRINQSQLTQAKHMMDAIAEQSRTQDGAQGDYRLAALSEIRAGRQHWQIYFSRGVSWLIPQQDEIHVINHINRFMQQTRWRNRHWRVDARLQSRWFIRPAGHGGVI